MADEATVKILITAVDEVSATLKRIETQLTESGKKMKKQTEETSKSFDKQMGSLLVLGQAANSVDNIFSSYQNLQLRLENSAERLANAQDRLRKTQYNLSKVQKDVNATAEDMAEAEADVESASRSLTIAQNNLAKTQGAVVGTYISIGTQTLSLIRSFPLLITEVKSLTAASLTFIATPIGATMAAFGAVMAAVTITTKNAKDAQEEYSQSLIDSEKSAKDLEEATKRVNDQYNEQYDAIRQVFGLVDDKLSKKGPQELDLIASIEEQEAKRAEAVLRGREKEVEALDYSIKKDRERLDVIQQTREAAQARNDATQSLETQRLDTLKNNGVKETELMIQPLANVLAFVKDTYQVEVLRISAQIRDQEIADQRAREEEHIASLNRIVEAEENARKKTKTASVVRSLAPSLPDVKSGIKSLLPKLGIPGFAEGGVVPGFKGQAQLAMVHGGETIIPPDSDMISYGTNETIVINIESIYGMDPKEVSRALKEELATKISI